MYPVTQIGLIDAEWTLWHLWRLSLSEAFTVALWGGLGNQMFQYALGRRLALSCGSRLLLDTTLVDRDPQRHFSLDSFRIVGERVKLPPLPPKALRPIWRRLPRVHRAWEKMAYSLFPLGNEILNENYGFDSRVIELHPPARLVGYWQSEKYFVDYGEAIRTDFQLVEGLTSHRARLAVKIAERNSVSVHVRRGDYVGNPFHGTCEPPWYSAAKEVIDKRISNPAYFVFSDDPDWSRRNLPFFGDATFVEPSEDGQDAQDLHLMSLCKHQIIANSSFSWWGAWLNRNPNKVVIAPQRWTLARVNIPDLLPPHWTKL